MNDNFLNLLSNFTVFNEVPKEQMVEMAQNTTTISLKRNKTVWKKGDLSKYLFLIVFGRVKIIKQSETGKDVIIEVFGPKDAIGVTSTLVGGHYITDAVCLSPVTLLCVPREQILKLLETVPGMALRSLKGMARRQRMLMQKIKELAGGGVEYRIAHLLLKLADRIGEKNPEENIIIPISLTRRDIADLVGTTVETAIRIMSRLKKMDIVTSNKNGIVIIDREALEELSKGGAVK
jgi:CRP/FNR family transcriptional regulator